MIEAVRHGARTLGPLLLRVGHREGYTFLGIGHWCPACLGLHAFAIDTPDLVGRRWTWNGSIEKPTFTPDRDLAWRGFKDLVPGGRCHYRLTDGIIHYLPDCLHVLRDSAVPLPAVPGQLL